ncbi:MAG: sigma-70 family RNA polymerase sigma factor [Bacteroidia bacterium]|nr:sigma-70 family RNA polymerase sigma factor [Bacteroidia bacterium]
MFFKKKPVISADTSDEALIQSYKKTEDTEYIGHLFDRYTQLAFLVCMKYLKDEEESRDTVMQIFEQLIYDLKKYEVQSFRFWLHTILKNKCLAVIAKKQKNVFVSTEAIDKLIRENVLEDDSEKEFYLNNLPRAMEKLNTEQKICINLFYLQQKSYKDIAELTGFEIGKVKSYIQNGKRNLKIHLTDLTKIY